MILCDTSVWIGHLRQTDPVLQRLLQENQILSHPFVIGELALGSLKQRSRVLNALNGLPGATVAGEHEVLDLISAKSLFGTGLGYVDIHLLASTLLTQGSQLWTGDKRLLEAARKLSLAFEP